MQIAKKNRERETSENIKKKEMGRSKSEARCKKHPNHKQTPGVCSSCLRERLSQLSSSKNTITTSCSSSTSCSSASSYYSSPSYYSSGSVSSSSCSSPDHYPSSSSFRISFGLFGRSRSSAFVARYRVGDDGVAGGRMKKGGFWSKLLRTSGKRREGGFSYCNTSNEMDANRICV